jgi:uncharacterized membrane protein YphA (DoxX/SURF4 family)
MKQITGISRLLVGLLFIISGLIKANDPLGFSYKLDEYFVVFNISWLSFSSLFLAMFISVIEIGLGIAVLMGVMMRKASWALLLMIIFFTGLTGFSAITNKVTDCGCFGDALKLTPWQSFYKDIVLLVLIGIIFFMRNRIKPLIGNMPGLSITWIGTALSLYFTYFCLNHLPVKDFRPYAVGKDWVKQMEIPPDAPKSEYKTVLLYSKDGLTQEFASDNYPWDDSTWVWVDTKSVLITEGFKPPIHDFVITNSEGSEITDDLLTTKGFHFILVAYDLEKTNKKIQPTVSLFAAAAEKMNIPFRGLTATGAEKTEAFRHDYQSGFQYYFADATTLKTIIRSNPGLILMNDSKVVMMWHYNDIPRFGEVVSRYGIK